MKRLLYCLLSLSLIILTQTSSYAQKNQSYSLSELEDYLVSLQTRHNWAIATTAAGATMCVIGIASGITALSNGQQALKDEIKNTSSIPTSSYYWMYADTGASKGWITAGLITSGIGVLSLLANNKKMVKTKVAINNKLVLELKPDKVVLSF